MKNYSKDYEKLDSEMLIIVDAFFSCMCEITKRKIKHDNKYLYSQEYFFISDVLAAIENVDEKSKNLIIKEYFLSYEPNWWYGRFKSKGDYISMKSKALKSFLKEFNCEM